MSGAPLLRRAGRAVLLAACATLLLSVPGCYRSASVDSRDAATPPVSDCAERSVSSPAAPPEPEAPSETGAREEPPPPLPAEKGGDVAADKLESPPAVPPRVEPKGTAEAPSEAPGADAAAGEKRPVPEAEPPRAERKPGAPPKTAKATPAPRTSRGPAPAAPASPSLPASPVTQASPAPAPSSAPGESVAVAALTAEQVFPQDAPRWARGFEELVYRVDFLGITMGYARFSFLGRKLLSGSEVYHLRVRAWTSNVLSLIYPVDDLIDYYLDVDTLVPLRQENRKERKEDDVAIYDQENGKIVYRYLKSGKIRKKVDVVPRIYDPVSAAYFIRTREMDEAERLSMYAGRKVWDLSAKPVGFERIRTEAGEVDTVVIEPVLRREGKVEHKGDMRMWMTRDERHVPVRLYAKFHKIRTWTLVGELVMMPEGEGGG